MISYEMEVHEYFKLHPEASLEDCCKELKIGYKTAQKWRKTFFSSYTSKEKKEIILEYFRQHPSVKIMQACEELGFAYRTVRKYYDEYYGIKREKRQNVKHSNILESVDFNDGTWKERCIGSLFVVAVVRPKAGMKKYEINNYESRIHNAFAGVKLMQGRNDSYILLFRDGRDEELEKEIVSLAKDKEFMDKTEDFVVSVLGTNEIIRIK